MVKKSIIITAGGIGKRMGGTLPKQFLPLQGKPLLFYTIERFYEYDPKIEILLTLPQDWLSYWQSLCEEFSFSIPHQVISGGKERYHSIQLALAYSTGNLVGVHDGVRPFVSIETISRCYEKAQLDGSAIPVMHIKESLRMLTDETLSVSVERSAYRSVQTPQVFQRNILVSAYERPFHDAITDDASLAEENGTTIYLVEGNEENIKITTPLDLSFCEFILLKK
jgi:2-C-methyl-D-erythritol 4-phosphate cytidylyltransferase